MCLKMILVHLDRSVHSGKRLDVALRLAEAHRARVIGLHASAPIFPAKWELERIAKDEAARIEAGFRERSEKAGISHEWRRVEGHSDKVVSSHARYADLTIVGQPDPAEPVETRGADIAGTVALEAGRPILAVPYAGTFQTLGERALIGWKDTREAARAVADALPLLGGAKEVVVLSVNPPTTSHISAEDVASFLAEHGIEAKTRKAPATDLADGEFLLSWAADFRSDLMVAGAYGHPRLTEIVFGGVTRELLRHMIVPVLFSH